MANGYDDSFSPPIWWLEKLGKVMVEQDWSDGDVIKRAKMVDTRRAWGPDRLVKMRAGNATIQLVIAVSEAAEIPSPVAIPVDFDEAEALDRWLKNRRKTAQSGSPHRELLIDAALDAGVASAHDHTKKVSSKNEGSPRGRGHRRASGGRQKATRS